MTVDGGEKFSGRWRLRRAGVVNVWHYIDTEFAITGGRLILRGKNGSGKSRALEMLFPYLLDADRRRMDATGSNKVSLDELMRTGSRGQNNRVGYLWIELSRPDGHLTIGAHVKYSASAHKSVVNFFTTDQRIGHQLHLIGDNREALSRDRLAEIIGSSNVSKTPEEHREVVRDKVFGLSGAAGRDRFGGLVQLLHTLRSPDVGNRIDEGRLPQILSDALPPLGEQTLSAAGQQLDGLSETQQAQQRLEVTREHLERFHRSYRGYAAVVISEASAAAIDSATIVESAHVQVHQLSAAARTLADEHREVREYWQHLTDQHDELTLAVAAIKEYPLFKEADDLRQRDAAVDGRRSAAQQALESARRARSTELSSVERLRQSCDAIRNAVGIAANGLADTVAFLAAAGLPTGALPASVYVTEEAVDPQHDPVMDSLDGTVSTIIRPNVAQVAVTPPDIAGSAVEAARSADSAKHRGQQAERRRLEAKRLDTERERVALLESEAERVRDEAIRDAAEAREAESNRDTEAIALNREVRGWVESEATVRLIPDFDWRQNALMQKVFEDFEILAGAGDDIDDLLVGIDSFANIVAQPARDEHTRALTRLVDEDDAGEQKRTELLEERSRLERADDPPPETAPWHTVHDGLPLWRAVDFAEGLSPAEMAGIEAALAAAGLLAATIDSAGQLTARNGEVVVDPSGPAVRSPLSDVLVFDETSSADKEMVERLLSSIGLDDAGAVTSINIDGRWRNGALRGRHRQSVAMHIGAGAREAARRTRIIEIDAVLASLREDADHREQRRVTIKEQQTELADHVADAPSSRALSNHRTAAAAALRRSVASNGRARTAEDAARMARSGWSRELETHRRACEAMALPFDIEDLGVAVRDCERAQTAANRFAEQCRAVARAIEQTQRARRDVEETVAARTQVESTTESLRREWASLAAEVAAQHAILDVEVEKVEEELRQTSAVLARTREQLTETNGKVDELEKEINSTASRLAVARSELERYSQELVDRATELDARMRMPGVASAAELEGIKSVAAPNDPEQVKSVAASAAGIVAGIKVVTLNQLQAALSKFEAETSGHLDVGREFDRGVQLVRIEGAGSGHDSAGALAYLTRRVAEGRQALTQRERDVFTGFILGGVADELRRRIGQARALVIAMNDSLSNIRTSHDIGVRIAWRLDKQEHELGRILQLLSIADAVRSESDNDELVALVRGRVERLHVEDPSAGYAEHLATALDYRSWHAVEVSILGPERDQVRHISKRAKISQGETRFVSYAALFAAADGYLSSLPEPGQALRLVLLDDAFAKVDEPTIGELMGLLVRLDIDFVMTGHALWGTVPEVPALDVYEIRRLGDSAVVTTRVHWDGKHRHIHALP